MFSRSKIKKLIVIFGKFPLKENKFNCQREPQYKFIHVAYVSLT